MAHVERDIRFLSFDGIELEGTFTSPQGGEFSHVAVLVPGIEVDREELGFYTDLAGYLADEGVASFRFDWRCHGYDSDRPLSELTLSGIYNDIGAAVANVESSSNRPAPVVLVSQSFSGGMASTWAARNEDRIACTLLLAPVLDYVSEYVEATTSGARDGSTAKGNRTGLSSDAARELESTGVVVSWRKTFCRAIVNEFYAFDVRLPAASAWILHGDQDTGVDIETSKRAAGAAGGVGLLIVPGAEHGFAEPGDDDLESDLTRRFYDLVFQEIAAIITRGSPTGNLLAWNPSDE